MVTSQAPPPGNLSLAALEGVLISAETEDLLREAWKKSIPRQFANDGKNRNPYCARQSERHTSCSIIAPTPSREMLDVFFTALRFREGVNG